jgi:hypothetical protein
MRIMVELSIEKGEAVEQAEPWRARCQVDGVVVALGAGDRGSAIAQLRRRVFQHLSTLEYPPRCVEFEVVEQRAA